MGFISDLLGGSKTRAPRIPTAGENISSAIQALTSNAGGLQNLAQQDFAIARDLGPQFNEQQLDLVALFDPQFLAQNLDLLEKAGVGLRDIEREVNPQEAQLRDLLVQQILDELQSPTDIDPFLQRELEQGIRGAQSARGTTQGNSAVTAEAITRGSFAEKLRRNRQQIGQQILRTNADTGINLRDAGSITPNRTAVIDPNTIRGGVSSANIFPSTLANAVGQNNLQSQLNFNVDQLNQNRGFRGLKNFLNLAGTVGGNVARGIGGLS